MGVSFSHQIIFNINNNSYDASEIRIISSLGNDYVNLSGSQQNIQVKWSPGNDTFIFDLNEEKIGKALNFRLIGITIIL